MALTRRGFLQATALAAAGTAARRASGASERVVVGVMGIHDRGMDLAREFARRDDCEVRYLCDPDSRLFAERAADVASIGGKAPQCVQDFRRMLDDPEVDAIAIATPDHWHALGTVMACQAGKDVYVEKPTSQSIWESRKMVEAARKYGRVVQVGTQNRSAEYVYEALDYARSEAFGPIHFIRVMNSKRREPMTPVADSPVPEGVDYDLWLGPAAERPFNENRFHYNWHWYWEYGGGDLANDGVHQIDLARWCVDKTLPKAVVSTGATYALKDMRETPDTQTVAWEFEDCTIALEQTLWTPYMRKMPLELRDKGTPANWPFNGTRIEVYGEKRYMFLGRMGDGWKVCDEAGEPILEEGGEYKATGTRHAANFIDCIKSRAKPNADIEDGHYSTLLAHYGNAAFRVGRRLHIDAATEGFIGDEEANALVRREYRAPWTVPESV